MTPLGLTVMRRAATLAHAVPGVRVRLRHDGRALLEVLRPAHPVVAPPGRWITPCTFRQAVGRAVQAAREGRTLAVLGLEHGVDPAVDIGAPEGQLIGGLVCVPTTSGSELAFATTAPPEAVEDMEHGVLDVRCHPDPVTEASLIVHTTRESPGSAQFSTELLQFQAVLAQCAVHELVHDREGFLRHAARPVIDHSRERPPRS
jgi:hypothetical protein